MSLSLVPDQQFLSLLLDMGFDPEQSSKALLQTGNKSVEAAIEFMSNATNTTPVSATAEPVKSNPLQEYRQAQQQKHQTARTEAPTSTATTNPASLKIDYDAIGSGLKLKGDSEESRQSFKEMMRQKEIEQREREKKEKARQLKMLRQQMAEEKKARSAQNNAAFGISTPAPSSTPSAAPASASAPATTTSTECTLQIRLPDGKTIKQTLQSTDTLAAVAAFVLQNSSDVQEGEFSLMTPFPRKEYEDAVFESTTLSQAGLAPRGSLVVQKTKNKGVVKKGEGVFPGSVVPGGMPYPGGMPFPYPGGRGMPYPFPGGGRGRAGAPAVGGDDDDDDSEVNEPMEDKGADVDEDTKLLCRQWLLSVEETPENQTQLLVFRPATHKFEQSNVSRASLEFSVNGTATYNSSQGHYKLKKEQSNMQLELSVSGLKLYDIVSLTDEILILRESDE